MAAPRCLKLPLTSFVAFSNAQYRLKVLASGGQTLISARFHFDGELRISRARCAIFTSIFVTGGRTSGSSPEGLAVLSEGICVLSVAANNRMAEGIRMCLLAFIRANRLSDRCLQPVMMVCANRVCLPHRVPESRNRQTISGRSFLGSI